MGLTKLVMRGAVLAVAATLLLACGGGGVPDLPETPARTADALPTVSARPEASRSSAAEQPAEASETPADSAAPDTSRATARPEPAEEAATTAPPPERTATRSALALPTPAAASPTPAQTPPSATSAPAAAATDPADTATSSWWLLLAVVVVAVVGVLLVLRRSRRRTAWRSELGEAEDEVAWLARTLIPELRRAASPEQAAGGWLVGSNRVGALADRLTALEATAPDDAGRARARELRTAVRTASSRLDSVISSGRLDNLQWDLDAVAVDLETAVDDRSRSPG
jgi:hypothetical protein